MKYVIYRRACDWQCDSDATDWDGWQEYEEFNNKYIAIQRAKELRKEDNESTFKVVVE